MSLVYRSRAWLLFGSGGCSIVVYCRFFVGFGICLLGVCCLLDLDCREVVKGIVFV